MRLVFMGTPDFAVASLAALHAAGHEVAAVVTAPDKPAGRGQRLQASAVKQWAQAQHLPVLQPPRLKDPAFLAQLAALQADLFVVVAFRMLPAEVWAMPPRGTINLHGSLLPQYRGAAPIHWAVLNGETETGVTTFYIEHEIDTGQILAARKTPIGPDETTGELYARLMQLGAQLLVDTVADIAAVRIQPHPQPAGAEGLKPAPKLFPADGLLDWNLPARQLHNRSRGLNPFPAAHTTYEGKLLNVLRSKMPVAPGEAQAVPG
ncbi:MAG: methionyl-tRNA formyltransferase, partial [bacterium]